MVMSIAGKAAPRGTAPAAMRMSVAGLAKSGAVAGAIKLGSAALSFLMFVTFAMIMDERQFGLYSATYAGASLVSFFASVGQQSTVLRFWPQYAEADDLPSAHGMMARAILVAFAGVSLTSLLIVAIGFVPYVGQGTPEWLPLCLSAAVLSLALAWSEFASGAFRAKGVLVWGLLPRDVIWRAATIALVLAIRSEHAHIGAVLATMITAGVLVICVLPQTIVLVRQTWSGRHPPLSAEQKAEFNRVTIGLWGATSLPPALGQVGTLLVAGILGPEIAGAVFVADRTTRLVLLALTGLNQALAPEISGAFYGGNRNHVQKMTSLTALGSGAAALLILAAFWLLGSWILAIFNPAYATPTMHAVLVIFGIGATIASLCGPTDLLMQLTGLQHYLMKLLVIVNVAGLAVTALLTWEFGALGVAFGMAGTVITAGVLGVAICRRTIGIDPSVLGLLHGPDAKAREDTQGSTP
jgi:O-antigen/teichoic acid export membrane protein